MQKRLQIRRGETANFYAGVHGRSQDFSKGGGGHTVSNRGYSRFRNLNIVGCLSKKRLTKGGSRAPQNPPPLATPLQGLHV